MEKQGKSEGDLIVRKEKGKAIPQIKKGKETTRKVKGQAKIMEEYQS